MKHPLLISLLTLLSACKLPDATTEINPEELTGMKKYEWYAQFTTPKGYNRMRITGGYFTLEDQTKMYFHTGFLPQGKWASPSGLRLVGPAKKYLPRQLNITWFSILENQAYSAECPVPFEQLQQDGANGFSADLPVGWQDKSFNRFVTGIAPGGYIQIWAFAIGAAHITISSCQGKPVNISFSETRLSQGGGYKSWKEYVDAYIEDYTPEQLQDLGKKAFPVNTWRDIYTRRYPYTIKVSGMRQQPAYAKLSTFGGEYYTFGAPRTPADRYDTHGVPDMLDIFTLSDRDDEVHKEFYRVHFDETEAIRAFEKFAETNQGKPFELHAEVSDLKTHVNITLTDGGQIYLFEKTRME